MTRLDVVLDNFQNIIVGNGFLKVIDSAHLHRFEVAFHVHTTSQDYSGQVPVELQNSFQHRPSFEGMTSLVYQNKIEIFVCQ